MLSSQWLDEPARSPLNRRELGCYHGDKGSDGHGCVRCVCWSNMKVALSGIPMRMEKRIILQSENRAARTSNRINPAWKNGMNWNERSPFHVFKCKWRTCRYSAYNLYNCLLTVLCHPSPCPVIAMHICSELTGYHLHGNYLQHAAVVRTEIQIAFPICQFPTGLNTMWL